MKKYEEMIYLQLLTEFIEKAKALRMDHLLSERPFLIARFALKSIARKHLKGTISIDEFIQVIDRV